MIKPCRESGRHAFGNRARRPRARFTVDPLVDEAYQFAYPRTSGLTGRASDEPAMSADGVTFGQAISKARKALGLSQKERAARVMKEEGGGSISPQYLNDIEHDRRSPSSGHLIRQFSGILNIPGNCLALIVHEWRGLRGWRAGFAA